MTKKRSGPKSPLTPKQRKIVASARAARLAAERDNPELAPKYPTEYKGPSRYKAPPPWPQTLEALAEGSGPYGETVIAEAKAVAVRQWATASGQASNPLPIIWECLSRHRAQIWRNLGITGPCWIWLNFPNGDYEKQATPVLNDLSPDSRCEAELVIAETYAEWEAAGCPGLDQPTLHFAYKCLLVQVWNGDLPTFEGCIPQP